MKDMRMKNILKLTSTMVLIAGSALAATSGTTVVSAVNPFKDSAPATGYVSATLTSTASPRAALPTTNKTINAISCNVRDTSGNEKNIGVTVSGTDLALASSGQASGTLAIGDRLNCVISYER